MTELERTVLEALDRVSGEKDKLIRSFERHQNLDVKLQSTIALAINLTSKLKDLTLDLTLPALNGDIVPAARKAELTEVLNDANRILYEYYKELGAVAR